MPQKTPVSKNQLLTLPEVYFLLNHELEYDSNEVIEYLQDKGIEWLRQQRILIEYLQSNPHYQEALGKFAEDGAYEKIVNFLYQNREALSCDNELAEFFKKSGHDRSITMDDAYVECIKTNPTFLVHLAKTKKDFSQKIAQALAPEDFRFLTGLYESMVEYSKDNELRKFAFANLLMTRQFSQPFCRVFRSTTPEFRAQDILALTSPELFFILKFAPNQTFEKAASLIAKLTVHGDSDSFFFSTSESFSLSGLEPSKEQILDFLDEFSPLLSHYQMLEVLDLFYDENQEMVISVIKALLDEENVILSKVDSTEITANLISLLVKKDVISQLNLKDKFSILSLISSNKNHIKPALVLFEAALESRDYLLMSVTLNAVGIRLYTGFDNLNTETPREVCVLSNFKELCQALIHSDSAEFLTPVLRLLKAEVSPEVYFSTLWSIAGYAEQNNSQMILRKIEPILSKLTQDEFIEKGRHKDFDALVDLASLENLEHIFSSPPQKLNPEAQRFIKNSQYFYSSCEDAITSENPITGLYDIMQAMYDGGKFSNNRVREIFTGCLHQLRQNFHKLVFVHNLFDNNTFSYGVHDKTTGKFVDFLPSIYRDITSEKKSSKLTLNIVPDLPLARYNLVFRFLVTANSEFFNEMALLLVKKLSKSNLNIQRRPCLEANFFWMSMSMGHYKMADLIRQAFAEKVNADIASVTPIDEVTRLSQLLHYFLRSRFLCDLNDIQTTSYVSSCLYVGFLVTKRENEQQVCGKNYQNFISEINKFFTDPKPISQSESSSDIVRKVSNILIHQGIVQPAVNLFQALDSSLTLSSSKIEFFQAYLATVSRTEEFNFNSLCRVAGMVNQIFQPNFSTAAKLALCNRNNFLGTRSDQFRSTLGAGIPSEVVKEIIIMTFGPSVENLKTFVASHLTTIFCEQLKPPLSAAVQEL